MARTAAQKREALSWMLGKTKGELTDDMQAIIQIGQKIHQKGLSKKLRQQETDFLKQFDKMQDFKEELIMLLLEISQQEWFDDNTDEQLKIFMSSLNKILNNNFDSNAQNKEEIKNNLALNLFDNNNSMTEIFRHRINNIIKNINNSLDDYIKANDNLLTNMVNGIDLLEEGKTSFTHSEVLHQIAIIDNGIYKEFVADDAAMRLLQQNRSVMRLQLLGKTTKEKMIEPSTGKEVEVKVKQYRNDDPSRQAYNMKLSTRTDLTRDIFFQSLKDVINQTTTSETPMFAKLINEDGKDEELQSNWEYYYTNANRISGLVSEDTGEVRVGRLNELFMQGRLYGNEDPKAWLDEQIKSGLSFDLDNHRWIYGGDQNIGIMRQDETKKYLDISQKSLVFDEDGRIQGYGYTQSTLNLIESGLETWETQASSEEKFSRQLRNRVLNNKLIDRMADNFIQPEIIKNPSFLFSMFPEVERSIEELADDVKTAVYNIPNTTITGNLFD